MKYQKAVESYIKNLTEAGYSKVEIARKKATLSKYLTYALVLFHPGIDESLRKIEHPSFYLRGKIYFNEKPERIRDVNRFLDILREEQREVRYLNLYLFIKSHRKDFLDNNKNDAVDRFLRAIGFSINLSSITKSVFKQSMDYLKIQARVRAESDSQLFILYCFNQGWVSFDPRKQKREIYAQVFEPNFLSSFHDRWQKALSDYISYLRYERNLSLGGIDYQVRKLKVFVLWLSEHKIKHPTKDIIKQFLEFKKENGVKDITLSKYLYTIKYFFDFLIDKGQFKINPAHELRLKNRFYSEGDVLTEKEVFKVIEYLDRKIAESKNKKGPVHRREHFIALRNLCMFHIFLSTGLRLSEISGIKLRDINHSKKTIRITAKGNKTVRQNIREINLDYYLWETLKRYLNMRKDYSQEYLWISSNDTPLSNSGINRSIKRLIQKAGINKNISPHRLRATCVSLYVKKGMDPFSLKNIMGHQSIATTMDKYTRLSEEELRDIWKKTNPLAGLDDE